MRAVCNRLLIVPDQNSFHFGLLHDADNKLEHETDSIIKHIEFLVEHKIKNEVRR